MAIQLFDVKVVRRSRKRQALIVRWIMALRNGSYKQGPGLLRGVQQQGDDRWCCLGVMLDIADPKGWIGRVNGPNGTGWAHRLGATNGRKAELPSGKTCSEFGLTRDVDGGGESAETWLASMNDTPKSFKQIALLLERSLKAALK